MLPIVFGVPMKRCFLEIILGGGGGLLEMLSGHPSNSPIAHSILKMGEI
jgi:hypothetical protein